MQSYPFTLPSPVTRIEVMGPHMAKHHLSNGQVIHHFTQADTGDPHDHPFPFDSTILIGGYEEEEYLLHLDGSFDIACLRRLPGASHSVKADTVHRITRLLEGECWTLITPGRKVKEPGFFRFKRGRIYRRDWNGRWRRLLPAKQHA